MDVARIGFIGTGWWATANHLPLLKKREECKGDVKLVAVCRLGAHELSFTLFMPCRAKSKSFNTISCPQF